MTKTIRFTFPICLYTGISALDLLTGEARVLVKATEYEVFQMAYYDDTLYFSTFWKGLYSLNMKTKVSRYHTVFARNRKKRYIRLTHLSFFCNIYLEGI